MRKQSDLSGDEANSLLQVTCKVRNRDLVDTIPPKHQAEPFKKIIIIIFLFLQWFN